MANRLLIWGTGFLARKFLDQGYNGEIIGFIQTNKTQEVFDGIPVFTPEQLEFEYDYIVVANHYTAEINDTCKNFNIDTEKVIFLCRLKVSVGVQNLDIISDV